MSAPIKLSIDIKKLKRSWMKDHTNGATYCELIVYQNDEPDQYGNEFAVKQGMPKEARDAGEKSGYCGNGKFLQSNAQRTSGPKKPKSDPKSWANPPPKDSRTLAQQAAELPEDDIPF